MVGNQPIYRLLLYAVLALLVVYVGVRQVYRCHRRAVRARETARALAAFSAQEFTTKDGYTLPYRLLLPQGYDPQRRYPLILFLHGISECGRDNRRPVAWLGEAFMQPSLRAAHPCFVLVPQCPPLEDWAGDNFVASRYRMYAEETPSLRATRALIAALARQYPIDRRRLYATGFSMGASGVWDLLGRHPGLFAAAIPVAGYTDTWTASRLKHTPVWIFHSTPRPHHAGCGVPQHGRRPPRCRLHRPLYRIPAHYT